MNDGTSKTLFLMEPVDMYFKLRWEHSQLVNPTDEESRRINAYRSLNAAITAFHMHDWVLSCLERRHYENMRKADLDLADEQALVDLLWRCPAYSFCESIANASKHYRLDPKRNKRRRRDVRTSEFLLGGPHVGTPMHWIPMVEDGESQMPLKSAIGDLLSIWRDILLRSGLATEADLERPPPLKRYLEI